MIRIQVFSEHSIVTAYYAHLVAREADFCVTHGAEPCDVGILEDEKQNLQAKMTRICAQHPSMRAMIVLSSTEDWQSKYSLNQKVRGVIALEDVSREISQAIRRTAEGGIWCPEKMIRQWMEVGTRGADSTSSQLTEREGEVLDLLMRRCCDKEIATMLDIQPRTVRFHVNNIFQRLSIHSRNELFALARVNPRSSLD